MVADLLRDPCRPRLCLVPGAGRPRDGVYWSLSANNQEKWEGGVEGKDGCMYCMPMVSKLVLRVTPGPAVAPSASAVSS